MHPTSDPANLPTKPVGPANQPAQPANAAPLVYPDLNSIDNPDSTTESPPPKSGPGNLIKTILLGILNWFVVPVLIVLVLHNFVFQAFHVIGSSMDPNLSDRDYLIISKIGASQAAAAKAFNKHNPYIPKRQEIIVFRYPKDPSLVFIKRVIALPGERVVVKDGTVTVYNDTNKTGFNPDAGTKRTSVPTEGQVDEIVPQGSVFVIGDNRNPNGSYDSREWGSLPSSYIIGDAIIRLLPVNQAGII